MAVLRMESDWEADTIERLYYYIRIPSSVLISPDIVFLYLIKKQYDILTYVQY